MRYLSRVVFLCLTALVALAGVSPAAEKVFYYHTDQAGTPLAMTDVGGTVVWKTDYKPFGEEQSINPAAIENNQKFIGKTKDVETGLYYFDARYMLDQIGRFMSPDPVGPIDQLTGKINQQILMNPQRLNPYAYALNNPYKYLDANGRWPEQVHNTIIQAAFSRGRYKLPPSAISAMQQGSREADSLKYQDSTHNHMHAMRTQGQSVEDAAGQTATFMARQIMEYKRLMAAGNTDEAFLAMGMAMHPIMDNTSPSHEGYQVWHLADARNHGRHESNEVFIGLVRTNPDFSAKTLDAIRGVYDVAK